MTWTVSVTAVAPWRHQPATHSIILDGAPEDTGRLIALLRQHGGPDAMALADEIEDQAWPVVAP
jgi:hypothetical protein